MSRSTTRQRASGSAAGFLAALIITLAHVELAEAQDAEEKAPTLAEAKAAFAKADRALNQAWSAAKGAVTGEAAAQLTQSQRSWLEFRDDRAQYESQQAGQKDSKQSPIWHTTAAELTESRAEWLRGRAQTAKEPPETLTGRWTDSYGGTLRVVQQQERLLFTCEVVRGPTYHTGEISGIGSWNQRIGWFSDKGRDPEKTEESNLAFVDRDGCLEIIGANTIHYHGARAHFDGIYCKVGSLDEKEQAELIKAAESGGESDHAEGGE